MPKSFQRQFSSAGALPEKSNPKNSPPLKEGWPKAGVVDVNNLKLVNLEEKMPNPSVLRTAPLKGEQLLDRNINNLPYLKTFRKKLRNTLTPAEAKLWTLLKSKQVKGRKFRRQFSVAKYILDFYCPAERLAVELDGQGHYQVAQAIYDQERDLFLLHCGIKVLRFENSWVWENPEELLEVVISHFGWRRNRPSSRLGLA